MTDVLCDVSSHIQTCSRAVPAKISLFIRLQEGGEIFTGQTGDTWWRANGTEMSNISTVPDYKYLTKISQNFLNILEETYTSVCQSVKTSGLTGWTPLSTGLKVAHHLNCVSSELNPVVLLLSVRHASPANILQFCSNSEKHAIWKIASLIILLYLYYIIYISYNTLSYISYYI